MTSISSHPSYTSTVTSVSSSFSSPSVSVNSPSSSAQSTYGASPSHQKDEQYADKSKGKLSDVACDKDMELGDDEWEYESLSWWEMIKLCIPVFPSQLGWAVGEALLIPYLISLGVEETLANAIWLVNPLVGFFIQPAIGSYSDRCNSKWGRRRPFLLLFHVGIMIGLIMIAFAPEIHLLVFSSFGYTPYTANQYATPSFLIIILSGCVIMELSNDLLTIPSRALLNDQLPEQQLEKGNAYFATMASFGAVVGLVMCFVPLQAVYPLSLLKTQLRATFVMCILFILISNFVTMTIKNDVNWDEMEEEAGGEEEGEGGEAEGEGEETEEGEGDEEERAEAEGSVDIKIKSVDEGTDELVDETGVGGEEEEKAEEEVVAKAAEQGHLGFIDSLLAFRLLPKQLIAIWVTQFSYWLVVMQISFWWTAWTGIVVYGADPMTDSEMFYSGVQYGIIGSLVHSIVSFFAAWALPVINNRWGVTRIYHLSAVLFSIATLMLWWFRDKTSAMVYMIFTGVLYPVINSNPFILIEVYTGDSGEGEEETEHTEENKESGLITEGNGKETSEMNESTPNTSVLLEKYTSTGEFDSTGDGDSLRDLSDSPSPRTLSAIGTPIYLPSHALDSLNSDERIEVLVESLKKDDEPTRDIYLSSSSLVPHTQDEMKEFNYLLPIHLNEAHEQSDLTETDLSPSSSSSSSSVSPSPSPPPLISSSLPVTQSEVDPSVGEVLSNEVSEESDATDSTSGDEGIMSDHNNDNIGSHSPPLPPLHSSHRHSIPLYAEEEPGYLSSDIEDPLPPPSPSLLHAPFPRPAVNISSITGDLTPLPLSPHTIANSNNNDSINAVSSSASAFSATVPIVPSVSADGEGDEGEGYGDEEPGSLMLSSSTHRGVLTALMNMSMGLAQIVSATIGGVLISWYGDITVVFALSSVLCLIVNGIVVGLGLSTYKEEEEEPEKSEEKAAEELKRVEEQNIIDREELEARRVAEQEAKKRALAVAELKRQRKEMERRMKLQQERQLLREILLSKPHHLHPPSHPSSSPPIAIPAPSNTDGRLGVGHSNNQTMYGSVDTGNALRTEDKESRRRKRKEKRRKEENQHKQDTHNTGAEEDVLDDERTSLLKERRNERRDRRKHLPHKKGKGKRDGDTGKGNEFANDFYILPHSVGEKIIAETHQLLLAHNVSHVSQLPRPVFLAIQKKLKDSIQAVPYRSLHRSHPIDANITARKGLTGRFHQGEEVKKERIRLHLGEKKKEKESKGEHIRPSPSPPPSASLVPPPSMTAVSSSIPHRSRRLVRVGDVVNEGTTVIAISGEKEKRRRDKERGVRMKLYQTEIETGLPLSRTP